MVCATTMERGHRRKTGVDVCRGVGWIAQTFMWMQATVAAGLWDMRRIAQHPSVAGLIHPAGGAPRVAAVMAILHEEGARESAGCWLGGRIAWRVPVVVGSAG